MSAQTSGNVSSDLPAKIAESEKALYLQFPEFSKDLKHIVNRLDVSLSPVKVAERKLQTSLSQEELFSILQKLRDVSQLPSSSIDQETLLYLEQQLADILGFEVSTQLDPCHLPFAKGIIAALAHLQFLPTSGESSHTYIPEAGTSLKRSYFGWDGSPFNESEPNQLEEAQLFWLAFPLNTCKNAFVNVSELKSWWKGKKLVVINPTDAIAVVAQVKDSFFDTSNKYQLGASPAVIREGSFWSPMNAGKSLVFFVPDNDNQIAYGTYLLYQ